MSDKEEYWAAGLVYIFTVTIDCAKCQEAIMEMKVPDLDHATISRVRKCLVTEFSDSLKKHECKDPFEETQGKKVGD